MVEIIRVNKKKNIIIIYCMSIANSMEEYLRKIQSSRKVLFDKFMKYGLDNILRDVLFLSKKHKKIDSIGSLKKRIISLT